MCACKQTLTISSSTSTSISTVDNLKCRFTKSTHMYLHTQHTHIYLNINSKMHTLIKIHTQDNYTSFTLHKHTYTNIKTQVTGLCLLCYTLYTLIHIYCILYTQIYATIFTHTMYTFSQNMIVIRTCLQKLMNVQ